MQKVIMATIIGLIACFYAQNMGNKPEEGYRIEVVIDTIQKMPYVETQAKEIRFIKPDGKVIKSLSFNKTILSGNKKYLLHFSDYKIKGSYDEVERILFNTRGEMKWKKKWKTYPGQRRDPELLCPYWAEGISSEGNAVYVMYIDSFDKTHLVVYDTTGEEVVNIVWISELRNIEISVDGKIIGAMTGESTEERKGYTGPYLFFLDVETKRIKVVKAWGISNNEGWMCSFVLSSGRPIPESGKIKIDWQPIGKEYNKIPGGGVKTKIVSFDAIPDDLSTLFLEGGEK